MAKKAPAKGSGSGLWRKRLLAVLLLPALLGLAYAALQILQDWSSGGEWRALPFVSFGVGAALWLVLYFSLPRTLWLYVFAHELTHVIAAHTSGAKVYKWNISSKGGQVMLDRVNWWIALAPYFIPLYSLLWTGLWLVVDFYRPLAAWDWIFFGVLGLTWAFHVAFTASMIGLGQSDLRGQGHFFSLVVIVGLNLALLLAVLVCVSERLTWAWAGRLFLESFAWGYQWVGWWLWRMVSAIGSSMAPIFGL